MIANDAARHSTTHKRQSHGGKFAKVIDGRKQPIRGLWERNGRFYAQLAIEDPNTGAKEVRRVPLVDDSGAPVATAAAAKARLEKLRTQRADNELPALRQAPKFHDYVKDYIKFLQAARTPAANSDGDEEAEQERIKKPGTITKEKSTLDRWAEHIGELRLNQIRRAHINAFLQKRKSAGMKNRTVNLDVVALRNLLNKAIDDGWLRTLPTVNMRPLPTRKTKRPLFSHKDLDRLCAAAFATRKNEAGQKIPVTRNAQEFTDYLRLMAYSGTRRNEALALRWSDVDFDRGQLTVGADADTKNSEVRHVEFNPKLKALLLEMKERRAPDSRWLFPSPQRGQKDVHAKTFRESLEQARAKAELGHIGFHDCRHHFISMCVMSGIDYMTIAKWVGHKDGGVLIGKVYGHLSNEHATRQAARIVFEPTVLEETA